MKNKPNHKTKKKANRMITPLPPGFEILQQRVSVSVLPVGSWVQFLDGGNKATVTQICIQADDRVSYELAWWSGGTRNTGWVSTAEIDMKATLERQRIGFTSKCEQ